MNNSAAVEKVLRQTFPEFNNKNQLIDYFVSFDFPEKQQKMVNWWQKVIEFLMNIENRTNITYPQLVQYVSFYNLKPTPLKDVIEYLAKRGVFVPEGEMQAKINAQPENTQNNSWFNTIMSFVGKKTEKQTKPIFSYGEKEAIFSKQLKESWKKRVRSYLNEVFEQHCRAMDEYKLAQKIEKCYKLDIVSIREILRELQLECVVRIDSSEQKTFVLFSNNPKDLANQEWCDLQAMKHKLREQIDKFINICTREQAKIKHLKQKARAQATDNNKASAKVTCRQICQIQKKIANISIKKTLIDNQLTNLEYNEMNKSMITLLEEAQKMYQQTLIDSSRMDDLIEKNMEIEHNAQEINTKMEVMAENAEQEEIDKDVETMLRELEREVKLAPKPTVEKKQAHVDIFERLARFEQADAQLN